jgi:hypothetical protein
MAERCNGVVDVGRSASSFQVLHKWNASIARLAILQISRLSILFFYSSSSVSSSSPQQHNNIRPNFAARLQPTIPSVLKVDSDNTRDSDNARDDSTDGPNPPLDPNKDTNLPCHQVYQPFVVGDASSSSAKRHCSSPELSDLGLQ